MTWEQRVWKGIERRWVDMLLEGLELKVLMTNKNWKHVAY